MIEFNIDIRPVLRVTSELANKLGDLRKPLNESALHMERETKLNFVRQTDPDGKPWAPLRTSTLKRKKTRAILRETSRLSAGIQALSASGTEVSVEDVSVYGLYHQRGTKRMARRQFLGFSPSNVEAIRTIFNDYFE